MIVTVGHRGARGVEPENTLLSFRKGIELGMDYVECDVQMTKDGEAVVVHPKTLAKMFGGNGDTRSKPLADWRELDMGKGEKMPTLQEVIDTVKGKVGLIVELKGEGTADKSVEIVKKNELENVLFLSYLRNEIKRVKELDASLPTGLVAREYSPEVIAAVKELGASVLFLPKGAASKERADELHSNKIHLGIWSADDQKTYEKMVGIGADYVVSDRPDLLRI